MKQVLNNEDALYWCEQFENNVVKADPEQHKMVLALQAMKLCRQALEKQIPKQVTHEATLYKCCTCPSCKNVVDKFEKWGESTVRITYSHCHFCGQALDWSDYGKNN